MHVVMIFQCLQKFAHLNAVGFAQLWKTLRNVTKFACHHRPVVLAKPLRHRVQIGPLGCETGARSALWNLGIIRMRERFEILCARLNRGGLNISRSVGVMRFNKTDVLK